MLSRFSSMAVALLMATSAAANPFAAKQSEISGDAKFKSQLMRNAIPTKNSQIRRLDEDDAFDLSNYSLKFQKCQFVKAFDQDLADSGADVMLSTDRFVIFRLCPSSSCGSCSSNYGEYAIDMTSYLQYTVAYRQDEQTAMCNTCNEQCYYAAEEEEAEEEYYNGRRRKLSYDSYDCDTCVAACNKIDNMEANLYVDATTFIKCAQLQEANDDDGNQQEALYAGPTCASQGSKIKIGVFSDENCMYLDSSKDVDNYLADENGQQMKISHALLKTVYDESECITCANNSDDDGAEDNEVCESVYALSGKCEEMHNFAGGMATASDQYTNQISSEDLVCEYIASLKSGTYSQEGDIVIGGSRAYTNGGTSTTGGQKFALTFFIIGTVGLAVYSAMLHSQLTKGGKADLSSQGGAMA